MENHLSGVCDLAAAAPPRVPWKSRRSVGGPQVLRGAPAVASGAHLELVLPALGQPADPRPLVGRDADEQSTSGKESRAVGAEVVSKHLKILHFCGLRTVNRGAAPERDGAAGRLDEPRARPSGAPGLGFHGSLRGPPRNPGSIGWLRHGLRPGEPDPDVHPVPNEESSGSKPSSGCQIPQTSRRRRSILALQRMDAGGSLNDRREWHRRRLGCEHGQI